MSQAENVVTTSRRSFIRGAVAASALIPTGAAALPVPQQKAAGVTAAPTPIEELWRELQAVSLEYKNAVKRRTKLERVRNRRMPRPDPSIVFSAANDADGLEYLVPNRKPHTLNDYIWSRCIEGALAEIEPSKQPALRSRLLARLELSRAYERKLQRMSREIGLSAVERKIDRLANRMSKLENRILSLPATTRADFAAKIAIYRDAGDDGRSIVRDLERLIAA
jgi:hypothetical protein